MLIRLMIIAILVVVIYRAARSWLSPADRGRNRAPLNPSADVDDVMIKDPVCGAYFPQRKGVAWNGPRQQMIFCSTQCRDRYLAGRS